MSKVTIAKEYIIVSTKSLATVSCRRQMGVQTTAQYLENSRIFAQGQQVGAAAATAVGGPQKSKSSSSVIHHGSRLIAKKMFRSRSKSQTRPNQVPCSWTPQGSCTWTSISGKQVILSDTTLLQLSEVERKMLQKVAMAKLQALNLGVNVKVPADSIGAPASKPKRKPYLLKRKALTTGIFDTGRKEGDASKEKDSSSGTGLVFGIPLAQCVENERVSRRSSSTIMSGSTASTTSPEEGTGINRVSSRSSFTSLIEQSRSDEKGSCESLMSPRDRMIGSVPGLLDSLGCESTVDLPVAVDDEPAVPNIVHTCIRYLEMHGLSTLGIFRVSTSKKRIRQLRDDFDSGKDAFVEDEQTPHDVATLLKEYLRDLPDPLLCRDLYQAFVQTQRIRNRKLQHEALQHLIELLPAANRDTLWTLLNFLSVVGRNAPDQRDAATGEIVQGNKMDSNNLATVFAPNILHCVKPGSGKEVANDKPEDRLDIINVVRALIDNNKSLFTVSSELLDEVYVHMMDLHPEALDQLLNKRDTNADESLEDLDSESQSNSAPWTPTALTSDISIEHALQKLEDESANGKPQSEPRRTYSREEFLHESAATGGPNIGMRVRSKDRTRETKKRREESSTRRRQHHEESTAMSLISRLRGSTSSRGQQDQDLELTTTLSKIRSSSLDSTDSQSELSHQSRVLRNTRDAQRGVITASLTIPVQQQQGLYCNPADTEDIPYIEDAIEPGKQQITIGLVKTTTSSGGPPIVPPRDRDRRQLIHQQTQRQRSMSGESDSSASIASYMFQQQQQPITIGSIILQQQQQAAVQMPCGYDSAVGSSATYSSPPHYTTHSSVSGSSVQDGGVYSSPPSWASTPPTSPDSQNKAVNYIPEVVGGDLYSKDKPLRRRTSTEHLKAGGQDPSLSLVRKLSSSSQKDSVNVTKKDQSASANKRDVPYTAAITSIGNAVLRSRTADFERISKADTRTKTTNTTSTVVSSSSAQGGSSAANKKYTKRRYTDSRHQTRHIPDSETLDNTQQVYKRKELISSVLSSK